MVLGLLRRTRRNVNGVVEVLNSHHNPILGNYYTLVVRELDINGEARGRRTPVLYPFRAHTESINVGDIVTGYASPRTKIMPYGWVPVSKLTVTRRAS